jgi:hypothetical protein
MRILEYVYVRLRWRTLLFVVEYYHRNRSDIFNENIKSYDRHIHLFNERSKHVHKTDFRSIIDANDTRYVRLLTLNCWRKQLIINVNTWEFNLIVLSVRSMRFDKCSSWLVSIGYWTSLSTCLSNCSNQAQRKWSIRTSADNWSSSSIIFVNCDNFSKHLEKNKFKHTNNVRLSFVFIEIYFSLYLSVMLWQCWLLRNTDTMRRFSFIKSSAKP